MLNSSALLRTQERQNMAGLPDERGRADIFEHYLSGLKLDPGLTPDRLAAEMAGAAEGLTGADIAYVCQRAAMFCVKEAARGSSELSNIAIMPHHLDAALCLVAGAHASDATPASPRLMLGQQRNARFGTSSHGTALCHESAIARSR